MTTFFPEEMAYLPRNDKHEEIIVVDHPDNQPLNILLKIQPDKYKNFETRYKKGGIIVYYVEPNVHKYEVVLLPEAISLFRADNFEEAVARSKIYEDKLLTYIGILQVDRRFRIPKLCYTMANHPTWTLAHLAAHLRLSFAFNKQEVLSELNSSDSMTGMSPLQVAIQTNDRVLVVKMIELGASKTHVDHNGNTVFHWAAASTPHMILTLYRSKMNGINSNNNDGKTPLDIAREKGKSECENIIRNVSKKS